MRMLQEDDKVESRKSESKTGERSDIQMMLYKLWYGFGCRRTCLYKTDQLFLMRYPSQVCLKYSYHSVVFTKQLVAIRGFLYNAGNLTGTAA